MASFSKKDNNTRKEFQRITISLASPQTIFEQSHGEVVKPETVSNITSIKDTLGCTTVIKKQDVKMKIKDIITIVLARSTKENGIVR